MSDCNDFINQMAKKLENKLNKKDFNVKISRMKKKTDKYFIYMSKNNNWLSFLSSFIVKHVKNIWNYIWHQKNMILKQKYFCKDCNMVFLSKLYYDKHMTYEKTH